MKSNSPSFFVVFLVATRVLVSVLGAYGFVWGFAALATASLSALGVGFHDAETAAAIVAFLLFPLIFLWVFAVRSLSVVCAVVVGGAVLMVVGAWAIQHSLLV